MINLKITMECPTADCNHTVQLFPLGPEAMYGNTCGGCDEFHQLAVFDRASLDAHDGEVAAAIPQEKAKK